MRLTGITLGAVLAAGLAGCGGPGPVTEAQASSVADETQTSWASQNMPEIESRYAKTVAGFTPDDPKMVTSWGQFSALQREFVKNGFDKVAVSERRIQLLGPDGFVVTGAGTFTNSRDPAKTARVRFTDVYQRDGETSNFVIVNEHVALDPASAGQEKPAASPPSPTR